MRVAARSVREDKANQVFSTGIKKTKEGAWLFFVFLTLTLEFVGGGAQSFRNIFVGAQTL